jgi:hypothetical protein
MAGHLCVIAVIAILAALTRESSEQQDQRYACLDSNHVTKFNTTNPHDSPFCVEYRDDLKNLNEFKNAAYYSNRDSDW